MITIYGIRFWKPGHRHHGKIRYVGQTARPLQVRLDAHFGRAKTSRQNALTTAMRKHGWEAFTIEALGECHSRNEANELERAFIANMKMLVSDGEGGLNLGAGGEGVDYTQAAIKNRHLAAVRTASYSAKQSARNVNADPSFVSAQRSALKKRWEDPEQRARQAELMKSIRSRPSVQAANAKRLAERNRSEEGRAKTAETNRRRARR